MNTLCVIRVVMALFREFSTGKGGFSEILILPSPSYPQGFEYLTRSNFFEEKGSLPLRYFFFKLLVCNRCENRVCAYIISVNRRFT